MKNNNKVSLLRRRKTAMDWIKKYLVLIIGSLIYSAGLEIFLVPNNIIDGGVVGISIMASYLTGIPFGVYMLVLNLPFLYLGYKQIGKTFAISTIISIIALSIFSEFLEPVPRITEDYFLAAIFGGIIAGAGVGLVIRQGGSLDGTEITAIILDRKTSFSVGEVVMFFNLFILGAAGFVFGWDKAMYSLVAYFNIFRPKMQTALPTMLMMFINRLICIEILELPMLRNRAAPPLYSARNG